MSQVLRYVIIRYFPWPERDEFINVGVLLESPAGTVYCLLEPRDYRLTTVLERSEVVELWEALEFSLFRTTEFAWDKVRRNHRLPRLLPMPLEECLSELSGALQCSDIRTILAQRDDSHLTLEYLNSLFDRQVVRHVKAPRKRPLEPRHLLKRRLRNDLAQWEVLERLLAAQDLVVTMTWPMDFVYTSDGSETGICVLDCGTRESSADIRVAYGAARDIEESGKANASVIAVAGNQKKNPSTFGLANRVLSNREPALRLIDYDSEYGREELRRRLQGDGISRLL